MSCKTDKERLIELIEQAVKNSEFMYPADVDTPCIADHLLANGVIVPPCKVGDTIYKLCSVNSNIKMGRMWDGKIVETNCDRCGYRNCSCYNIGLRELDDPNFINVIEDITIYNPEFLVKIMPYFGTIYFNTKEEAEQALAERSGENC